MRGWGWEAGPAHFPFAPPTFPSPRPLPLPQGSFSWTPYLAMACIFAFILSFGIGPGELGPWGSLLWAWLKDQGCLGEG